METKNTEDSKPPNVPIVSALIASAKNTKSPLINILQGYAMFISGDVITQTVVKRLLLTI
jgi:hypothetical protein